MILKNHLSIHFPRTHTVCFRRGSDNIVALISYSLSEVTGYKKDDGIE